MNLKLARKFIDDYCKKYFVNYINKGDVYKSIYKASSEVVTKKLVNLCNENKASLDVIKLLGFSVDPNDNLEKWIFDKIKTFVEKKYKNKNFGENYINNLLSKDNLQRINKTKQEYILELQKEFYFNKNNSILKSVEDQYHERQRILELRLNHSINIIKNIYNMNNDIIINVSNYIKKSINIDNLYNNSYNNSYNNQDNKNGDDINGDDINGDDVNGDDKKNVLSKDIGHYLEINKVDKNTFNTSITKIAEEAISSKSESLLQGIEEFKYIYYNLICNYDYLYQVHSIVNYLKSLRDKTIRNFKEPTKETQKTIIEEFIRDSMKI